MGSNIPFSASAQESSFFTPTMIPSLALWFDASDPGTITQSGGLVSEWRDKSSNAYSVSQATVGNRPTYATNLLNGLPGVQLSGTKYLFQLGSNMPNFSSSPATTVYMVAKNGSTLAPQGWNFLNTMTYIGPDLATPRYFFSFYEENTPRLSLYTNNVLAGFNSSYFVPLNSNAIVGFAASASSNYLFFNGSNTAFTSTGAPPSANNETWFFFGDDNSNYVTDENIYEFVGFNTLLTTAQQQAVEGYLATKWGLQSSLSNGHPYKTTPLPFAPTFIRSPSYPTSVVNNPQFDPTLIPGCQLWLDAADSTTITGTTSITAWRDKSGNANNPAIFGSPNITVGTINNVKAMWFNGSSGTWGTFSNSGPTVSGFAVGTMNSGTVGYGRMIGLGNNPGNDDFGSGSCPFLLRQSGNQAFCTRRFQTDRTYSSYTYDAPFLASIIYDGTNGNLYVNGATIVQFGSTGNFGYSNYSVGCGIYSISENTIDTWKGYVGEVILYRNALTNAQRQQVEAYLAYKWKLNPLLSTQNIYAPGSYLTFVNPPRIPALPMRRAVQNNKFLPTQISGCQLWLDAADSSRIAIATGVSQLNDKSTNAYNLTQATTALQPSYSANLITFSSNKYLNIPQAAINNTATYSLFLVFNPIASTNWILQKQYNGVSSRTMLSTTRYWQNNTGTTNYLYWTAHANTGAIANSAAALSTSTLQVVELVYDASTLTMYRNGNVLSTTSSASYGIENETNATNFTIGSWIADGTIMDSGVTNFQFGELLYYNTALTTTQRQQVEGYLAWKWKLKSQFPSDHPFFLIPPLPLS